jgi:hypothetical protein
MKKLILCLALLAAAALYAQDYAFGPMFSNGDRVATISTAGGPFLSVLSQRLTYLAISPATASANTGNFSGYGDSTVASANCGSTAGFKTAGCTTQDTTNYRGWNSNSADGYEMGTNVFVQAQGNIASVTTVRAWAFTMTNQTPATMCASANPAGNYMGFRFDTTASDTVWQAVTKDGTTQNIVSTGVAPDTANQQTFSIVQSNALANVKFYIDGVLVATSAANLPTAATALGLVHCNRATAGSGQQIQATYVYIFNDYEN